MSSGWRVILMPLSDTFTFQSSLRTGVLVKCLCPLPHGRNLANFVHIQSNKLPSRWKTGLQFSSQAASKSWHLLVAGSVVIKTVAVISPVENVFTVLQEENININNGVQNGLDSISVNDMEEMPSKKDEWRMRISHANKGRVPWNKGVKHSPETIALIRERTKQAMQDPKVKKKLLNCAHPQSENTKMKIGIAVRKALEKWRKKKKLQETCLLEWEENIAEAARIGGAYGEEELQWDAYAILKEKMHQEWLQALKMGKAIGKRKDKRAHKSVEQKRKISEAIKAKWEDPDYRQRACSGMKTIHGNRPYSSVRRVVRKRSVNENRPSPLVRSVRKQILKEGAKSSAPKTAEKNYKYLTVLNTCRLVSPTHFSDSMADEKLDRIKQLQANRSTTEMMKRQAAERARLLIAETQKAVDSLEAAAVTNATAQASLFETRKLLSEAERTLQSAESANNADGCVLQRSLRTNGDAESLQSNHYMDNSFLSPPAKPGPFDVNDTNYLSFSNNRKENDYDTYESRAGISLNGMLTDAISCHAHIYSHSTEIGRTEVLGYVNSLFGTPNNTPEDTAKIFEAMTDETIGNNTMFHSDQNFPCPSVNHASMVDESAVLDNTKIFEGRPVPNLLKDITVSVDAKSVASNGQTENIAGIAETRSAHTGNGILASNKVAKKMWVRGRLIQVKGD